MLLAIILLTIGTAGYITMLFRGKSLRTLKSRLNDPVFMIAFVLGLTCTMWGIVELHKNKEVAPDKQDVVVIREEGGAY